MGIITMRCFGYLNFLPVLFLTAFFINPANAGECDDLLEQAGQVSILTKQSALYKDAQNKCPNDALVNYKYAFSLERLRKYKQALKYYKKAATLDPSSAKYLFGVADAYRMTNNIQNAVDSYQRGLKLQPDNFRAQKSLKAMRKKLATMKPPKKATPPPPPPPPKVKQVKKEVIKKKKIDLKLNIKKPNNIKTDMAFSTTYKQPEKKYLDILKDKQSDDKKNWH